MDGKEGGKDGSVSVLVQKRSRQLDSRITDDLRYSRADALHHAWVRCYNAIRPSGGREAMLYENGLNCLLIAR